MIGVVANPAEHAAVREFFELFKTPWEFYRQNRRYEVLLCAGDGEFQETDVRLILIYSSNEVAFDGKAHIQCASSKGEAPLPSYKGTRIPIYGACTSVRKKGSSDGAEGAACLPVLHVRQPGAAALIRVGYDLFREIRVLLTVGQPVANAGIPTLDLHIALLRELIVSGGISLVEIPPIPAGHRFIACLTHDLDHPLIRNHRLDHTMLGFLYRSTLACLFDASRGRVSWRNLATNWSAAVKLPFVHLGLVKDFWGGFTGYPGMESGSPSTFFVIPFKGFPGRSWQGPAPSRRAAAYSASEISAQVRELISAGCEVGLHGIDAWLDTSSARSELDEIRRITGIGDIGVRMHWLYFDQQSPEVLEKAGADYDSTSGYNETVGYRSGTTQAYKPLQASRLLELPLHVMDTALFFPCYLGLSRVQARQQIGKLIANAREFGGVLTVNWHDRSITPERLWGDVYAALLDDLRSNGAWFATAAQAVAWFRKRRSAKFEDSSSKSGLPLPAAATAADEKLPALQLRVHHGMETQQNLAIGAFASSPALTSV
ncbi:MAG TPA: hypothetical protein VKW06_11925 [Candidatus Angelobacter sp.]|nr:hypothetical protein [Candidatus Angelobacter sp.]